MRLFFLLFTLFIANVFAQDTQVNNESNSLEQVLDNDSADTVNQVKDVSFSIITEVPLFSGCEIYDSNQERKECMEVNIQKHVSENFNGNVVKPYCVEKSLGGFCEKKEYWPGFSEGAAKILVQFKIDKTGKVVDIRVRAPHPNFVKEATRVMELLPDFKPGKMQGKLVAVLYTLPITLRI